MPQFFLALLFQAMVALDDPEPGANLVDYRPCAQTCLFAICQWHQLPVKWEEVKAHLGPVDDARTHSFEDISRAAEAMGMFSIGLHTNRERLRSIPLPAILQVTDYTNAESPPHFVVVLETSADGVHLLDPPYPSYFLAWSQVEKTWTGRVMVVSKTKAEVDRVRAMARAERSHNWIAVSLLSLGALIVLLTIGRRLLRLAVARAMESPVRVLGRVGAMVLVLVLLVGGSVLWGDQRLLGPAKPLLVFPAPVVDFGEMPPGEHKTRILLRNGGKAPLKISGYSSSCTCADVKLPAVIGAGESYEMPITIVTIPGPRKAVISIDSNDSNGRRTLVVTWRGKVKPVLSPSMIVATMPLGAGPYKRRVRVNYPSGTDPVPLLLSSVQCDLPGIGLKVVSSNPRARAAEQEGEVIGTLGEIVLEFSAAPPTAPGFVESICKISFAQNGSLSEIPFVFSVQFVSPLRPSPAQIAFVAPSADKLVGDSRVIILSSVPEAAPVTVTGCPSWLSVTTERMESS